MSLIKIKYILFPLQVWRIGIILKKLTFRKVVKAKATFPLVSSNFHKTTFLKSFFKVINQSLKILTRGSFHLNIYSYPEGLNFCHFHPSRQISSRLLLGCQFKVAIASSLLATVLATSPMRLSAKT